MGGPARVFAWLAFAAAAQVAAATDRFVPRDPGFVVADVARLAPDARLRPLLDAWHADRRAGVPAIASGTALADAFVARARERREPAWFGRAEGVLAPLAKLPGAGAAIRRRYADVLQFRHEFAAAEWLLDDVLAQDPRDESARTLRASVRLVRGDFAGARPDCAQLAVGGEPTIGIACLAEALAGGGDLERARGLLATTTPAIRDAGYFIAMRAELAERAGELERAIADYRVALGAAPTDDSIRAALADALATRGDAAAAFAVLEVERPSLALRVRQAIHAPRERRAAFEALAREWLALEAARGDAMHLREAAMLSLASGDARGALEAATRNFATQRELADVRVYARAAVAARDSDARVRVHAWLAQTGFRDVATERILARAAGR
jgi:tetratricopeptide (TPR) repeat protein